MFSGFNAFDSRLNSGEQLSSHEEKLYHEIAVPLLKSVPKEQTFQNFNKKDTDLVLRIKKQIEVIAPSMRSRLLEGLLTNQIEMSNWMGDCYTFKTTEYDDYVNHVDLVVEWESPNGEPVRIAIDVTVADDRDVQADKVERVADRLKDGRGFNIKYFESEIEGKQQPLWNIPLILIGANKDSLGRLCAALSQDGNLQRQYFNIKNTIQKKDFDKLDFQITLLDEIIDQLNHQKLLLEKNGQEKSELYKNILNASNMLENILKEKDSPDLIDLGEPIELNKFSSLY